MQALKQQFNDSAPLRKFRDGEALWFWFVSSQRIRDGLRRGRESDTRPCELIDIETLVTRLYLSGKLSADQLDAMKEYGGRRRAPNQHVWAENRAAGLWSAAMRTLTFAAAARGWVE